MGIQIHIVGNLTADPELRYTQSGLPVAGFSVAVNERKFNRDTNQWEDGETTFVRCSAWREMAEQVAASLVKGNRVMLSGKVDLKEYETRDGAKGAALEMNVDEIGASLRYATAIVTKVAPKGQPGQPNQTYQQTPQGYGQPTPQGYGPGAQQPWAQPQQGQQPQQPQQPWQQPSPNNGPGAMGQPPQGWAQPGAYGDDTPF
jgi:single-strand DNA-binding protein